MIYVYIIHNNIPLTLILKGSVTDPTSLCISTVQFPVSSLIISVYYK